MPVLTQIADLDVILQHPPGEFYLLCGPSRLILSVFLLIVKSY
jgi:hypothetical protein